MNKFTLPVSFDSANRRRDKSVRLSFTSTLELSTDDFMVIDRELQQTGWIVFSPNEIIDTDIPVDDAPTDLKSPSKRLQGILYAYHMQKDGDPAKFRTFYESTIEKYISKIKEQLD